MAKGQSLESQGSSPSMSTGSFCLLLWLLISPYKREIRSSGCWALNHHRGMGRQQLMDWGGKADSPNSHITLLLDLKYKMQAFFPCFPIAKPSPGGGGGDEELWPLCVTGMELDWDAKGHRVRHLVPISVKQNLNGGGRRVFIHGKDGR